MATAKTLAAKPAAKKAAAPKKTTSTVAKTVSKIPVKAPVATLVKAPAAAPVKPPAVVPAKPVVATKATAPKAAKPAKEAKVKKDKQVRDSFTMPKTEYAVLDTLKLRASKLASPVKKSELLRAGVKALAAMADAQFLAAVKAVPTIKTGRPSGKN